MQDISRVNGVSSFRSKERSGIAEFQVCKIGKAIFKSNCKTAMTIDNQRRFDEVARLRF